MPEILELTEDYPIGIEYFWKNIYQRDGNKNTTAIAKWRNCLGRYKLNRSNLSVELLEYIDNFFYNISGNLGEFLYIDPVDNFATITPINSKLGTTTQGLAVKFVDPYTTKNTVTYQLAKVYRINAKSQYRYIHRPINNEFFLVDTTASYTIDWDKGIIEFASDQGEEIAWEGNFAILCELETDSLNVIRLTNEEITELEDCNKYDLKSWDFVEVKENSFVTKQSNFDGFVNHTFALTDNISRLKKSVFSTNIELGDSGYKFKKSRWNNPLIEHELGERDINKPLEIDYIITLWRVTRGGAIPIRYQDDWNHMIDSLSLTVEHNNVKINPIKFINLKFINLNFEEIDANTYIRFLVGQPAGNSLLASEAINNAALGFRELIKQIIYNGDETLTNKYVSIDSTFENNWLNFPDLRTNQTEPNKHLYLYLFPDAATDYHGYSVIPQQEPTAIYNLNLNDFLATYNQRDYFRAIIYAILPDTTSTVIYDFYNYFKNHLVNAINGTGSYSTSLIPYNISFQLNVDAYSPAEYYFNEVLDDVQLIDNATINNTNYLSDITLPICTCFKIERLDGVILGFTDHDHTVKIGEELYFPSLTKLESINKTYETNINTTNNTHVFRNDGFKIEDIKANKYFNAKYTISIVNWNDTTKQNIIFVGYFGKITVNYQGSESFTLNSEIRSVFSKLKQKNTAVTVKLCPLKLGESGVGLCNADMTNNIDYFNVVTVLSQKQFIVDSNNTTDNYYGSIFFTGGLNNGISGTIYTYDGTTKTITLWENLPYLINVADTLGAIRVCNKDVNSCSNDFNNILNHGGFPNIPGNDQLQKTNR